MLAKAFHITASLFCCEHLVDLQEAVHLAAFVLLLLHPLREALPLALLDGVGALEGPASPPVRLAHVVTRVTASAHEAGGHEVTKETQRKKEAKPLFVIDCVNYGCSSRSIGLCSAVLKPRVWILAVAILVFGAGSDHI